MVLTPGTRLGPYEITAQIGVGGMGEVYRATDTNLKRQVAIKVLPETVAGDAERLARFQREAEILAALNHPNIAHIHGLEKSDGQVALVMELVEGPTLADRIAQGPIRVDDALPIARQIAEALEAAHEQGIIHRDLKPANIKVRGDGTVKVLDFGLAKAMGPTDASGAASASASMSPTITSPAMTQMGMILGTAAYMSPEQAKGRAVDARTDVWAFGCVLYEMLTGRRAFEGDDVSEVYAAVIKLEPQWESLPPDLPRTLRAFVESCLRKDPRQRVHSVADVRLAIEGAFESPESTATATPRTAFWQQPFALAGLLGVAVIAALVTWVLTPQPDVPPAAVSRFTHVLPDSHSFRNTARPGIAVSPDGRSFVYNTSAGLYLRAIGELDARLIPGTEGGLITPFFSPDGESLGYVDVNRRQLVRMPIAGGSAVPIAALPGAPVGASWSPDGTIVFDTPDGIWRVPATGGEPTRIIDDDGAERLVRPQLLPGGDAVLFTSVPDDDQAAAQVVVQSLSTGNRTVVVESGSDGRYLPTGHVIYAAGTDLFGVAFDARDLAVVGGAVQLVAGVRRSDDDMWSIAQYAVADDGMLAYVADDGLGSQGRLTWVTREGQETPDGAVLDDPRNPRLSPDGTRLALIVDDQLWVRYFDARQPIKLTASGSHWTPLWTPDGQSLVFETDPDANGRSLFMLPADGSGSTPEAVSPSGHFHPAGWSADGQLLANRLVEGTGDNIVRWSLSATDMVEAVAATTADERDAALSPDGRWLAYVSNQTGRLEIYVRPYPGPGGAERISPSGGRHPVWSRRGDELYYLEPSPDVSRLMAVPYTATETFAFTSPRALFDFPYLGSNTQPPSFDVAADGRFLVLRKPNRSADEPERIVVVQNWFEELRSLVPTP